MSPVYVIFHHPHKLTVMLLWSMVLVCDAALGNTCSSDIVIRAFTPSTTFFVSFWCDSFFSPFFHNRFLFYFEFWQLRQIIYKSAALTSLAFSFSSAPFPIVNFRHIPSFLFPFTFVAKILFLDALWVAFHALQGALLLSQKSSRANPQIYCPCYVSTSRFHWHSKRIFGTGRR